MPRQELTQESVADAVCRYYDENGKFPSAAGGDATDCFGHKETWSAVDQALRYGRRGLPPGGSLSAFIKNTDTMNLPLLSKLGAPVAATPTTPTKKTKEEVKLLQRLAQVPDSWKEVEEIHTRLREDHGYKWDSVNGPRNNTTVLNMITDPLASIKEPLTNSAEAVNDLKFHALQKPKGKMKPMELSEECGFTDDFIHSHRDTDRATWEKLKKKAKDVTISFFDGDHGHVDYEVTDRGTGVCVSNARASILEIAGDNKTNKGTNMRSSGQFGVGGISALRFADGSVYVSYATKTYSFDGVTSKVRDIDNPVVWATVMKIVTLENGIPVLCCLVDANGDLPSLPPKLVKQKVPGSALWNMAAQLPNNQKHDTSTAAGKAKKELHRSEVKKVIAAGAATDWTLEPVHTGTRVRHYGYNLHGFNSANINKNDVRRLMHTYFTRTLHPFTFFDHRQTHFFNHSWKFQRSRAIAGLTPYLENSDSVVFGKKKSAILDVPFETEWGKKEELSVRVWVLKRANETLNGVGPLRANYAAEKRVRAALKIGEKDSLTAEALKNIKANPQSHPAALVKDAEIVIEGRSSGGAGPTTKQVVQDRTVLYTLNGITHDAARGSRLFQDCKMSAFDGRAIVEVQLDRLSPHTAAGLVDAKREGLVKNSKTYKNMYAALVAALKAYEPLRVLYQEVRDLTDSRLGAADEDLLKGVNKFLKMVGVQKLLTKNGPKKPDPHPLGTNTTLTKLQIVPQKDAKVWLYTGKDGKPNRRAKLVVASDAPNGFPVSSSEANIILGGGSTKLVNGVHFSDGYATFTCEWDGLEPEQESTIQIVAKNRLTGASVASLPVPCCVAKKSGGGSGDSSKGSAKSKTPKVIPRPITKADWGVPPGSPFTAESVARIEAVGDDAFNVYVNVDNLVLGQQMDIRNYTSAHKELVRRQFVTWMTGHIYSQEYGPDGYESRREENGFSGIERTQADKEADYRISRGIFMASKLKREVSADDED